MTNEVNKSVEEWGANLDSGRKEIFEKLFNDHYQHFKVFALKYLKDPILAEDAVQEVFMKFWMNADRWDTDRPLSPYLFTILKNHVTNLLKSSSVQILRQFESMKVHNATTNETQDLMDLGEYANRLKVGIETLSVKKRKIFLMKVYEGLSNEEIAQQEHVSVNTVKSQFQQASKFIRHYLKYGTLAEMP